MGWRWKFIMLILRIRKTLEGKGAVCVGSTLEVGVRVFVFARLKFFHFRHFFFAFSFFIFRASNFKKILFFDLNEKINNKKISLSENLRRLKKIFY